MIETKNARIVSTMLGREDHGIFTFMKVHAIGHYLDDEWINFADFAEGLASSD